MSYWWIFLFGNLFLFCVKTGYLRRSDMAGQAQ